MLECAYTSACMGTLTKCTFEWGAENPHYMQQAWGISFQQPRPRSVCYGWAREPSDRSSSIMADNQVSPSMMVVTAALKNQQLLPWEPTLVQLLLSQHSPRGSSPQYNKHIVVVWGWEISMRTVKYGYCVCVLKGCIGCRK